MLTQLYICGLFVCILFYSDRLSALCLPDTAHPVLVENACVASEVLRHLDAPLAGMRHYSWPCRMERFNYPGCHVILDGCHNGDSVTKFLQSLRSQYGRSKIITLFGAGLEKSLGDMLLPLIQLSDAVVMVQSKHFRSLSEVDLVEKAKAVALLSAGSTVGSSEDRVASDADTAVVVGSGESFFLLDGRDLMPPQQFRVEGGTVAVRLQEVLGCIKKSALRDSKIGPGDKISAEQQQKEEEPHTFIAVCGSLFVAAEAREYLFKISPERFAPNDWVREGDPDLVFATPTWANKP